MAQELQALGGLAPRFFHESGTMSYALQRLAHNAVGACAQLRAKFRGLLCQKSFPMMRHLFDALVLPTISHFYFLL